MLGQFRDLDVSNRFVWLRGFPDMVARQQALEAFYGGPVWARHGPAAAATMIDSDDVLLLRPYRVHCAITPNARRRPPPGVSGNGPGIVAATIVLVDCERIGG